MPELEEIRAWFETRGLGLLLSETSSAGKAYAYIYGGHPRQLKKTVSGDSLLDAAKKARQAVESGGASAAAPLQPSAESSSSATLTISVSDQTTVSNEPAAKVEIPPPDLIDAHTFILRWQRTEQQGVWMVQAYDGAGKLLGMGLGDDREDALLELAEHLMPHEKDS